jgi:pyruvate-ferredoxin/flavodoxin oxidoreductase
VPAYLEKYDILKGLKNGGTFLLNSIWDVEETRQHIPDHMKRYMADHDIAFYIINATQIAEEIGLGGRTNTIMQSAFFRISGVIPYETAVDYMKKAVVKDFGRKGEEIVRMNHAAIDRGGEVTKIDIPADWKSLSGEKVSAELDVPDFIKNVVMPINAMKGDDLPVSAFLGREDGTFPAGTTAYEKRGIAVHVPKWIPDNCIQCNQCAYVCPHACIRPFLIDESEMKMLPEGTPALKAVPKTFDGLQFRIQLSPLDCTGCGNCVDVCPAKTKALVMEPLESQMEQDKLWNIISKNVSYKDTIANKEQNIKNSQFAQPLFEFSGACAGCGETPYIKLITQLYGDRMMVANATGCSSIYGGSAPSTPYTVNAKGEGPAWANSLFEDNAEYGFGMATAVSKLRERIALRMQLILEGDYSADLKAACQEWIDGRKDAAKSREASAKVIPMLEKETSEVAKELVSLKQYFVKKSVWMFGGDGWAYDIGYGGLDHVIASGEDVNILVLDTEVYSNTGGQASKSTPVGAVAKFAASGKKVRKKDLGMMAMSYGFVYVAQLAMGANQTQYLKALREAEAYPGPSLIIAYSPCINHGLRNGMGKAQEQQAHAVEAGYWSLYRYNPLLEEEGKNPFQLDSKEPDFTKFQSFLDSEVRYTSLKKSFPKEAVELFGAAEENAKWRYYSYRRMADMDFSKK